jgi:hypothetical protein
MPFRDRNRIDKRLVDDRARSINVAADPGLLRVARPPIAVRAVARGPKVGDFADQSPC